MRYVLSGKLIIFYIIAITMIQLLNIMVYWSMRYIWFFTNKQTEDSIGKKIPLDWIILYGNIISFILVFQKSIPFITKQQYYMENLTVRDLIIATLLISICAIINILLLRIHQISSEILYLKIKGLLSYVGIASIITFLSVIYPKLMLSKNDLFMNVLAAFIIIGVYLYSQSFGKVRITSGPFIQHVDQENLAIMWTTNKNSTGYLLYGNNEENVKKVYESTNGIINANSKTHKVIIQISNNKNFVYKVASRKVNKYLPYEVLYGNTIESDYKKVKNNIDKDKVTFYILNDIHEHEEIYKRFLSKNDYDFVVLNGDMTNCADEADIIINKFLKPLSQYTEGVKPVYIVRGNHETRGKYQGDLLNYIALPNNRYYYTFKIRTLFAIVLDSGEDKLDSHEEYGGLANFKEYRDKQSKWLEALSETDEYKNALHRVAFVHIPLNSYENIDEASYLKDYQDDWTKTLNNMRIQYVFSGHTHVPEVIEANEKAKFETFIGGGEHSDINNYVAIKVTVLNEEIQIQNIRYEDDNIDRISISN